jgi:predicted secreted Zn-dependent protease
MTDREWTNPGMPAEPPVSLGQLCTSEAKLSESVKYYDFFGTRADSAGTSLRQRLLVSTDYQGRENRFTGQTDWHIEWRSCFEPVGTSCRIAGVTSVVNVTYTLPRWADRRSAPPGVRDRWDRYITSLAAHEKGHGAIALEVARMIERSLVGLHSEEGCEALNVRSAGIVDDVMTHGEALQREYDRVTAHGSTQGARFPF